MRLRRASLKGRINGGGLRRKIQEFTHESRHRLLVLVNSINRSLVRPERLWFVTLTYPSTWPADPKIWKKHLQTLQKRLRRAFGPMAVIWKLEPQRRGAPHFHLLILVPPSFVDGLAIVVRRHRAKRIVTEWRGGQLSQFRSWLSQSWFEVVGSGDEKHLRAGTNCEPLEAWRKVISYASKYLGKSCAFETSGGSTQTVGRFWGVWLREDLPIAWKTRQVPHRVWAMVRRTVRRLYQSRGAEHLGHIGGRDRSATVFLSGEIIERLLTWAMREQFILGGMFRSTARMIYLLKLKKTVNAFFDSGEAARQQRHREDQIIGRFVPACHRRGGGAP